jgi:hypothetical protein
LLGSGRGSGAQPASAAGTAEGVEGFGAGKAGKEGAADASTALAAMGDALPVYLFTQPRAALRAAPNSENASPRPPFSPN